MKRSINILNHLRIGSLFIGFLLLSACSYKTVDTACFIYKPIYLSDEAIDSLKNFPRERYEIALHNKTWEDLCTGN